LGGSRGAALQTDAIADLAEVMQKEGFLASPSTASESPAAPCALLSAAVTSDLLNRMFAGFIHPGTITFVPPRGTNILGAYDSDMAQAKGSVPREKPDRSANIDGTSAGRTESLAG
jgi:hypothetical protein